MSAFDHHDEPYDEGTLKKLEIYGCFLRAWLQVFLHTKYHPGPLRFFDFFSGPGRDRTGKAGSPMILMEELSKQWELIRKSGRGVEVYFNDYSRRKSEALDALCRTGGFPVIPIVQAKEFQVAFSEQKHRIGEAPTLVFLDQCGVKCVTREIFLFLTKRKQTDVLFFFASSHQRRFSEQFANQLNIPTNTPYWDVHRRVADCYRSWARKGYFVGQYSIMKGGNIYGLVFGSGHALGMYKFLTADSGEEANYEIDAPAKQTDLFDEKKLTKREQLGDELEELIRAKTLRSDADVVLHCLTQGVLPSKVAPAVYQRLLDAGVIANSRQKPRSSYDAVNDPRPLVFAP